MRLPALLGLLLLLRFAPACGDVSTAPAPATSVARFAPGPAAAGPVAWGDVPFPSDLYRDASGAIALGELPTALSDRPIFDAFRDLLATRDGFCTTCGIHFAIEGAILPDAAWPAPGFGPPPGSDGDPAALIAGAVVLADVDPDSPERGRVFPLRYQWDPARGLLSVRPAPGVVLHGARRYAAALTSRVRAADGTPLGASPAFLSARDGRGPGDGEAARLRAHLSPALGELERIGLDRSRVVALAAFTTGDPTTDLRGARAAVQGGVSPTAVVDRTWRGRELDELLGMPSEDRPGIDVPPIPGTGGTRAIVHRTLAAVVAGRFRAPRIVSGEGRAIGLLRRDAAGAVAAGPPEDVPFLLTIPAGAAREDLPVAIAHHGFNASRTTGFATAETAARSGVAVLAIDAFQHGDRAVSASDRVNSMRGGLPGGDGFAESEPADVSARVFGVLGTAPGLEGFPGYPLATLLQFTADVASAARLVRDGGLAAAAAAALGQPLGFDATRVGFVGNSLGAVVGVPSLVVEPTLRAGVENVPPGSIVEVLATSPEFRPLVEVVFLPRLGVEGLFDEVARHLLMDPVVDLSRWVLEPADPLALARHLLTDRVVPGPPPEVLFQWAALDEVAPPGPTESLLAAVGSPRATRYDPAAHGMLEVRDQASRYLPPAAPPFPARPEPVPVRNPIEEEHREIGDFLGATLAGPVPGGGGG
jgi:hypothetical protein